MAETVKGLLGRKEKRIKENPEARDRKSRR